MRDVKTRAAMEQPKTRQKDAIGIQFLGVLKLLIWQQKNTLTLSVNESSEDCLYG